METEKYGVMGLVTRGFVDAFRHRMFVLGVVILAAAAAGLQWAVDALGVHLRKRALPLRQPLTELDAGPSKLGSYRVRQKIALADEMVNGLGTDQYINWFLDDTTRAPGDPHKHPILFVTYYTGKPDQVPHVPEVCYVGGGYAPDSVENSTLEIPELDEAIRTVPVRILTFVRSKLGVREQPPVVYTFHANGSFRAGREAVRGAMANPFERYGYFSKVEITFWTPPRLAAPGATDGGPDRAASIDAARSLMQVVLPLLVERHWPDWERRYDNLQDADERPADSAPADSVNR